MLSFFDWTFPRLDKVNNVLLLIHNLDVLPQKDLNPHVPLLLLFTASAQTHIFPEIRIDAVRFLDLLLDAVPESVVCGWNESSLGHGKRALEGYLGILSAGTKFDGAEGLLKRIDNIHVCLIMSCPPCPGPAQAISTASVVLSPQVAAFVQIYTLFNLIILLVKIGSLAIPFFLFESCNRPTVFCIQRERECTSTNLVLATFFREYSAIRRIYKHIPFHTPRHEWQAFNLEYGSRVRVF